MIEVATAPRGNRLAPVENSVDDQLIGNALLSNTTTCEASRLLIPHAFIGDSIRMGDYIPPDDWDWYKIAAFRVYDLMSLIDSVVLHEQIFSLPASLPNDVGELELRNRLVESGALAPLPKEDDHNLIGKALMAALSTVGVKHSRLSFEDFSPFITNELRLARHSAQAIGSGSSRFAEGDDLAEWGGGIARRARSFDEAARDMMMWIPRDTGRYVSKMSLRAMYYIFASEHYGLPYLASANVQAMQRRFPNYLQPSVRERLYERLASALQTTVDAVAQDVHGVPVFLPPFSALVLDRASTPAEIPSEVLAMRAEYSDLRTKMRELEHDRLKARSLNDRLKSLRRIERLGREVVRPFEQPSQMKLEAPLRYIPDAVEVAANPTNPAGWAKVLLGAPAEALISWYWRRPVVKLVRTAKAVGELKDYNDLLTKHFGEEVASDTMALQKMLRKQEN